ncbi:hypothetical protein [Methylocystis hirsuta]|uniref:Uncharacterized protein n=1 Tax=Methylocystis hirsuta TaxID=369798 RepID=A0A3M9XR52_9HYPH|nr:hypothetical protein [Methylocystis hirsuta]RNJ49390.1 hypothetical protein D1O30_07020 [Methylocystis hirsuta]
MHDVLHEIVLNGKSPDEVLPALVKTNVGGEVAITKVADTPLNYLRFRSKNPISEIQYAAALVFLNGHEPGGGKSPTAAALETALRLRRSTNEIAYEQKIERAHLLRDSMTPAEVARMDLVVQGHVGRMSGRDDSGGASDPETRLLRRIDATRKFTEWLRPREVSILFDLLVREQPTGVIARRWGAHPDMMRFWIREALLVLAKRLEETDAHFATFVATIRERERG